MAETGVWAPCESPAHAASMAASTSDADLMVTVGDRVVVDGNLVRAPRYRASSRITLLRMAGTQHHPLSAGHAQESDAARCPAPQSSHKLAARTPSMTPAPRGVAAEPERRAAARARLSGGLGHRLRPSPDLDWPGGRSRRPCRARGGRTSFFNVHVPYTRGTSQQTFFCYWTVRGKIVPVPYALWSKVGFLSLSYTEHATIT